MKLNRVVVTGYGLTSPIGNTPEEFWNSLKTDDKSSRRCYHQYV